MPALFDEGFFVREAAWHGMGIVLAEYPGREQAMELAGHNFTVIERPILIQGNVSTITAPGYKALIKSGTSTVLNVVKDTYAVIDNSTCWDIAEDLFAEGFQWETGITLDEGRTCALTLKLDEPIVLPGDNSVTLPFGCLSWSHDGTSALKVRSGAIRQVCANTVGASEAEGKKLGTDFTFRHTKNAKARIEEARNAVRGTRESFNVYADLMTELGHLGVTPAQRDLFVSEIIGDRGGLVSKSATVTDRVKDNIETERAKINSLFFGPTIPEAHGLTGYGLHLAGVEYFDHLRAFRSKDSYVKRTLIADNPAKAGLIKTIREVVAA